MKTIVLAFFLFVITPFSSKEKQMNHKLYVRVNRPTIHQQLELIHSELELKNSELKIMIAELK
jgi:hypothetical protein